MSLEPIHEVAAGYVEHEDENVKMLALHVLGTSTPDELLEHLSTAQKRADEWRGVAMEASGDTAFLREQQRQLMSAHGDFARALRVLMEAQ